MRWLRRCRGGPLELSRDGGFGGDCGSIGCDGSSVDEFEKAARDAFAHQASINADIMEEAEQLAREMREMEWTFTARRCEEERVMEKCMAAPVQRWAPTWQREARKREEETLVPATSAASREAQQREAHKREEEKYVVAASAVSAAVVSAIIVAAVTRVAAAVIADAAQAPQAGAARAAPTSEKSFIIFVKTGGSTITISVLPSNSIAVVMQKIEDKQRVPMTSQHPIFAGKVLERDSTVFDCGIKKEATLTLCVWGRGGARSKSMSGGALSKSKKKKKKKGKQSSKPKTKAGEQSTSTPTCPPNTGGGFTASSSCRSTNKLDRASELVVLGRDITAVEQSLNSVLSRAEAGGVLSHQDVEILKIAAQTCKSISCKVTSVGGYIGGTGFTYAMNREDVERRRGGGPSPTAIETMQKHSVEPELTPSAAVPTPGPVRAPINLTRAETRTQLIAAAASNKSFVAKSGGVAWNAEQMAQGHRPSEKGEKFGWAEAEVGHEVAVVWTGTGAEKGNVYTATVTKKRADGLFDVEYREIGDGIETEQKVSWKRMAPLRRPPTAAALTCASAAVTLAPPRNGTHYTAWEAAEYFVPPITSEQKTRIVTAMIKQNFVNVERRTLLRLAAKVRRGARRGDGMLHEHFGGAGGRPSIASVAAAKAYARKAVASGKVVEFDDVKTFLEAENAAARKRKKLGPNKNKCKVSNKIVKNYMAMMLLNNDMKPTKKPQTVTPWRYVAMHSFRSMASWLDVIALTHLILATGPIPLNRVCPSDNKLVNLVRKATGQEYYCVRPDLISSTDEAGIFVSAVDDSGQFKLVLADALRNDSVHSSYSLTGAKFTNGIRMRTTTTTTATGQMACQCWTITGLREEELPTSTCPSGMLALKVTHFNPGAATDSRCDAPGYIVFVRRGTSEDVFNAWYDKNIFYEYVKAQRMEHGWVPGAPVPPDLTWAASADGAASALRVLAVEEVIARDCAARIRRVKTPAAGSLVTQPCDLMPYFRSLRKLLHAACASKLVQCTAVQKAFLAAVKRLGSVLNLNATKLEAIASTVAVLPMIIAKAATPKGIVSGFASAGIVGPDQKTPDFDGIVATCQRSLTETEHKILISTFKKRYDKLLSDGYVQQEVYDECNFSEDLDAKGKVVRRDAPISQENRRYAQVNNHEGVRAERKVRTHIATERAGTVAAAAQVKQCKKHADANACADKVRGRVNARLAAAAVAQERAPKRLGGYRALCNGTLEDFGKATAQELKAFIHVRTFTTLKIATGWKWPNKQNVAAAQQGTRCLIKLGYDARARKVLLPDAVVVVAAVAAPVEPTVIVLALRPNAAVESQPRPSELLVDAEWCGRVQSSLTAGVGTWCVDGDVANALAVLLLSRLNTHIQQRVADERKQSSWVWDFVVSNLSRAAAMVVGFGHAKSNLVTVTPSISASLLHPAPASFVSVATPFQAGVAGGDKLEGCYLFYDGANGNFIRSGKAVGELFAESLDTTRILPTHSRLLTHTTLPSLIIGATSDFGARFKQHHKAAKEATSSNFYMRFPTKESPNKMGPRHLKGFFDNLSLKVAAGFDRTDAAAVAHLCAVEEGKRIFFWSTQVLEHMGRCKFSGSTTLPEKQLHMIGYLIELVYDLCLSPAANVSESPGFEAALGIFGRH